MSVFSDIVEVAFDYALPYFGPLVGAVTVFEFVVGAVSAVDAAKLIILSVALGVMSAIYNKCDALLQEFARRAHSAPPPTKDDHPPDYYDRLA